MWQITSLFTYLAFMSHGQRTPIIVDESCSGVVAQWVKQLAFDNSRSNSHALAEAMLTGREGIAHASDRLNAAKALAKLFLAFNPVVAFMPSSSRMPTARLRTVEEAIPSARIVMPDMAISEEAEPGKLLTREKLIKGGVLVAYFGALYKALQQLGLDYPVGPEFDRFLPWNFQYMAALGDPEASSGTGAEKWGIWRQDPGPRGVPLGDYEKDISAQGGKAPNGWTFDPSSWWVEEHGLIMETPASLPLQRFEQDGDNMKVVAPKKRYIVTGGRETKSVLTVHSDGRWELSSGNLHDVTHLPCRSAVYTPAKGGVCKPTKEQQSKFPVKPGALMPELDGCNKQDWAVLFVIAEEK